MLLYPKKQVYVNGFLKLILKRKEKEKEILIINILTKIFCFDIMWSI